MAQLLGASSDHAGHSSDSDAEIDTSSGNDVLNEKGDINAVVVMGEASESEEESEDTYANKSIERSMERSMSRLSAKERPPAPSSTPTNQHDSGELNDEFNAKYNSILHRRLRDKNEHLRKELNDIACNPYNEATKEIKTLTQQLIKSQKMVQGVSSTLRRVSKELLQLEDSYAALQAGRSRLPKVVYANGRAKTPADNLSDPGSPETVAGVEATE